MKEENNKQKNQFILPIVIAAILIITALIVCLFLLILKKEPIADTIIYGKIYTATDEKKLVESMVIKDETIIYTGEKSKAEKYKGENTKILEYDDGMILPGISDTHTHVTMDFQVAKDQINLSDANSKEDCLKIIKDFINTHPDEEMYLGMGWQYEFFENGIPTKDLLDEISKDKPIYLRSSDAHSAWTNSAMLNLMGIDKNTEDPIGGEIKKDQKGEPAGMIKETALGIYAKPLLPVYSVEEYKNFILQAQEYYASLGYTAYEEIFIDTDEANTNIYNAYEELDKEGRLSLRVQGAWTIPNNENYIENTEKAIKLKNESAGGNFELTDLKFFMDGVAESHGALFSEPYADEPETYGLDRWPEGESMNHLVDCIKLGNENDMVAHFHAIGDEAVTKALNAIEQAKKEFNNPKIHNVITHLENVKESDYKRFKELDVIPAANLAWGSRVSAEHYAMEEKLIGTERANNAYPYKKLVDAGATISFATDYPPGSIALPFAGFSVGITRSILGAEDLVRNESLRLTREEALKALTINGAIQMRQEDIRGTLEEGKQADFIIIDTNLLTCIPYKSIYTTVLKTFVNGKEIYSYPNE